MARQLADIGARPRLDTHLGSLYRHRHFTAALTRGRVKASVSGTKLGVVWLLLTPLANAAVFYLVFGVLLGERQTTENYALFLIIGVLTYSVVSRCLQAGVSAPKTLSGLSGSLPVPKASGDAAAVLTELLSGIWVVPLLAVTSVFGGYFSALALALGLSALALVSLFCLGAGAALAWLGRLVPDSAKALPFFLRAGGFLFGVYFPLSTAAQHLGALGVVLEWSPIAVYLDLLRDSLIYGQFNPSTWVAGVAWAVISFAGAVLLTWQQENRHG